MELGSKNITSLLPSLDTHIHLDTNFIYKYCAILTNQNTSNFVDLFDFVQHSAPLRSASATARMTPALRPGKPPQRRRPSIR